MALTVVYLLSNGRGATYIGATVDLTHRLRQHNEELRGGARRTHARGPWEVVACVSGFTCWRDALRFEYAWRRACRGCVRGGGSLLWRKRGLDALLHRPRWSSTSPHVSRVTVVVHAWPVANIVFTDVTAHEQYGAFAVREREVGVHDDGQDPGGVAVGVAPQPEGERAERACQ